jgi:subtilisin family serine protease
MVNKSRLRRWHSIPILLLTATAVSLSAQESPRKFKAGAPLEATTIVSSEAVAKYRRARPMAPVIVKFKSESVAAVAGTTLRANGLRTVNIQSAAASRQFERLANDRRAFQAAAARNVPQARVVHDLSVVLGGVSMVVPEDQVEELSRLPGVQQVYRDQLMQLSTERSPQFINATPLHALGDVGRGAGVVVGVLDTGIWPEHPSYSDPDPNGQAYPAPPATWTGTACEFGSAVPGDAPFACNNKLIGANRIMATYDIVEGLLPTEFPSARDDNGHGTHTSSTAAGNARVNANIFGVNRGRVSGIAPRAHVVMYKVCGDEGCFVSDSAAAVQQSILDGVDVLNFSIDGGQSPYSDAVSLAFLDAYNAGIFVAASAGNSGPGADTVAHREPWVTTVAASTTNRHFLNSATVTASNGDTITVTGASVTAGLGNTPVIIAADAPFNDPLCQTSTADGAFTGAVVVCRRGVNARVEKSFNVQRRGGVGMILYNPVLQGLSTDNHYIPTSHIENDQGAALLAFLGTHTGETATLTAGAASAVQGDKMAAFSSRGGPGQTLGISKPDVTAPGVQILAGHTPAPATPLGGPPGQLFQAIDGTSMSSPHVAGAAAVLAGLHPSWTPGQIKSALMLTAKNTGVFKEDGVTNSDPWDRGSGRIRLHEANDPGLSISDTGANFLALQANLSTANYPSLYVPSHPGIVTVNRRLQSEMNTPSSWHTQITAPADVKVSITPSFFDLAAGASIDVAITVDASAVPVGQFRFARIRFNGGSSNIADFPISFVRRETPLTFAKSCTPSTFPRLTNTNCTVTLTNTSFDDANVTVTDNLPARLRLLSVTGATFVDNQNWAFNGVINGAEPPNVTIAPGGSPAGGYLPLSAFGIPPIGGVGDESIVNFNTPAFTYAGETYSSLGVTSNGYVVVGGGTGADVDFINQNLPNPARPNNVLAPFWTDLNPGAGGALRIGTLTDGADTWIVIDYAAVRNFSSATTQTFQIWIGVNGDANPGQDISYAYGPVGGGDLGFLTVGAENRFGNRGQNRFFNGAGVAPVNGTQLVVSSTPGAPGETKVISFTARGQSVGPWTNCARATAAVIFFGTATACTSGTVTAP